MNCRHCNAPIPQDGIFCAQCGKSVQSNCAGCNKPLIEGAVFCPFCGTKVQQDPPNQGVQAQPKMHPNTNGYDEYYYPPRKPRVKRSNDAKSRIIKRVMTLIQVWFISAVLILMFGLSFLPIYKIDSNEQFDDLKSVLDSNFDIEFDFTTIEVISALFSKRISMEEFFERIEEDGEKALGDIVYKADKDLTEKDIKKIEKWFNNYNFLKILTVEEVITVAPATTYLLLISLMLCGLSLMILSLVAAIFALIHAIKATTNPDYTYKNRSKLIFSILAAVSLFATIIVGSSGGTALVGGILSTLLLSVIALGAGFAFKHIYERERLPHLGLLITNVASLIMVLILALTSGSAIIKTTMKYNQQKSSGFVTTSHSVGFGAFTLIGTLNYAQMDDDNLSSLSTTKLKSNVRIVKAALIIKSESMYGTSHQSLTMGNYGLGDLTEDEFNIARDLVYYSFVAPDKDMLLSTLSPEGVLYYAEMSNVHNALGTMAGIMSLIAILGYSAVLSLLFMKLLYALAEGKFKKETLLHALSIVFFSLAAMASLTYSIVANHAISQLSSESFKLAASFMGYFNVALAVIALVGHIVLPRILRRTKSRALSYAPPIANIQSNEQTNTHADAQNMQGAQADVQPSSDVQTETHDTQAEVQSDAQPNAHDEVQSDTHDKLNEESIE